MQKKLLILLSRKSGARKNVRREIEELLKDYDVKAEIHEVDTPPQAVKIIEAWKHPYDAIVVYGGDGTVTSVIKAMVRKAAKLIILPGGTGNLIAKYLGVPSSPTKLLGMYLSGNYTKSYFDVSRIDDDQLVLDIHMGWLAESTLATDNTLKKKLGLLAYGVQAFAQLPKQQRQKYRYRLDDGKEREVWAYSSIFANKAIQNFFGFRLFNKLDRPSTVEIAFLLSLNPLRFLLWAIGRFVTGRNLAGFLKVHYCYRVEILEAPKTMLMDDEELNMTYPLTIDAGSGMVLIVMPKKAPKRNIFAALDSKLKHLWYVGVEQLRNMVFGTPLYKYSQVMPHLYLGGSIRRRARREFSSWGVKAILNMRETANKGFDDFEQLHLPTKDLNAPSMETLKKGVDFIDKNIGASSGVYVHCRQGRGRGPTMVAGYLIAKHGMTTAEAIKYLEKVRPMTEILRGQRKRLKEFEASLNRNDP